MVQTRFQVEIATASLGYLSVRMQVSESIVLRGGRCLFMEEGSFCLIGAAYPGSGAPMDKGRIPRDLFGIFWISLSIVISGQVFKR